VARVGGVICRRVGYEIFTFYFHWKILLLFILMRRKAVFGECGKIIDTCVIIPHENKK